MAQKGPPMTAPKKALPPSPLPSPTPERKKEPSSPRGGAPSAPAPRGNLPPSPKPPASPRTKRVFGEPWKVQVASAIALYKFDGEGDRLPLNPGDRLRIQEIGYGWFKGLNRETDCMGIFPVGYVRVLPDGYRENDSVPDPEEEVIIRAAQMLREWGTLMNTWMKEHRFDKAKAIRLHIVAVLKAKEMFLDPKTKPEERKSLRKTLFQAFTRCTAELGLSLTVHSADGVYADALNTSPYDLYKLYCAADTGYNAEKSVQDPTSPRQAAMGSSITAANDKPKKENTKNQVQVFLKYNAFVCKVDEDNDSSVELLFSLYSAAKRKDISEPYLVNLTNKLMVQDLERIDLQKTIFTNADVNDAMLVCRVVRVGKISRTQKTTSRYRIPFGVAAVPISVVLKEKNSRFESLLPIYKLESGSLSALLERIVQNEVQPTLGSGVALEIKVYNTPELSELKDEVVNFNKIAVSQMLEIDPALLRPGVVRNDLYFIFERAEIQQEGKKTAKNVELTISVRNSLDGSLVPACLSPGVSVQLVDEVHTVVHYHDNAPVFQEVVRVELAPEMLSKCHVLVEARHCTTKDEKKGKLFSLGSFFFTSAVGTIIENGSIQVPLYKPPVQQKGVKGVAYLRPEENGLKASREFVYVTAQLASTKLIQNASLYKLLKWEKYEAEMSDVLNRFTFVDTLDLVKVIRDLLPCLFAMMDARSDLRMQVFDALSYLIALLVTGRFDAFAPLVDEYFETQFADPNSYHHILSCLTHYFRSFSDPKNAKQFREALRGLQYWFKIITKSKRAETYSPDPEQFTRELEALMLLINQLLQSKERANVGAQMLTLKAFDSLLFRSIGPFFSDERFGRLLLNLLGSLEYDEARPTINLEKLEVIQSILNGSGFMERPVVRNAVLPVLIAEIHLHLSKSPQEFAKCMELLAVIFSKVQAVMRSENIPMPFATDCAVFIPHLTHAISKLSPGVAMDHAILAFLNLFAVLPKDTVAHFFNTLPGAKVKDLLTSVLRTVMFLLKKSLPRNWFSMSAFQACTIVTILNAFRPVLMTRIKSFPKEIALWTAFLELMFATMTLPQLQVEHLTESKRQLMLRRYGDLRLEAGLVLRKTWRELKVLQSIFVPKFIPHFLSLIMLKQPDVREIGAEMYWAVLWREIEDTGEFKVVGSATIDNLNQLSQADDTPIDFVEFEEFFIRSCRDRLATAKKEQPSQGEVGEAFLQEISSLLILVRRVKTLPPGPEFEEERILATMELMAYLKSTDRKEIFIRYVQQLSEMLSESGSFLEAGLALQLHEEMLTWSDDVVPAVETFVEEPQRVRKERLLLRIIDLFANAKQWERAIPRIRELRERYEQVTYQFEALSALMHKEADMFNQIATTPRFFSNYFRVGFYGGGFGETVRNKQFIYKGFELESLPDFTQRLQQVYRKAEILKTTVVSPEVVQSDGQHLLITAVTPSCKEELEGRKRTFPPGMPTLLAKYHENNDLSVFSYSKPQKGECVAASDVSDPQVKEFASLWVKRIYMETAESFPSYFKRMEVVKVHEVDVSPIQNAVADIEAKNLSLVQLTAATQRDANQLGPLSMLLNGIIDAAVNGGTKIYTTLFLAPGYVAARPQDEPMCDTLRNLLVEQVEKAALALSVHRRMCPPSLLGLQGKMEEFFEALEKQMIPFGYTPAPAPVSPRDKAGLASSAVNAGLASMGTSTTDLKSSSKVSKTAWTSATNPPELRKQKSANQMDKDGNVRTGTIVQGMPSNNPLPPARGAGTVVVGSPTTSTTSAATSAATAASNAAKPDLESQKSRGFLNKSKKDLK